MLNKLGVFMLKATSLLPMWLLYGVSNILYVLLYHVFSYRKKVVLRNLHHSFPEKSEKEIHTIMKEFYKHFTDLGVEIIKAFSISEKEILKRVQIKDNGLLEECYKNNQNIILVSGHYGNWEWLGLAISQYAKMEMISVYKPIQNVPFNDFFKEMRSQFGADIVPMKQFFRQVIKKRKQQIMPSLVADQTPHKGEIEYWTQFLNQDTPVYLGVEKMTQMLKIPAYYTAMNKIKRGHYEIELVKISDGVNEPEFSITNKHVKILEKHIQQSPAYWLWSHKRWKYKKENLD